MLCFPVPLCPTHWELGRPTEIAQPPLHLKGAPAAPCQLYRNWFSAAAIAGSPARRPYHCPLESEQMPVPFSTHYSRPQPLPRGNHRAGCAPAPSHSVSTADCTSRGRRRTPTTCGSRRSGNPPETRPFLPSRENYLQFHAPPQRLPPGTNTPTAAFAQLPGAHRSSRPFRTPQPSRQFVFACSWKLLIGWNSPTHRGSSAVVLPTPLR